MHLQVQRTSPGRIVSSLEGAVDRLTVPVIRRKLLGVARETTTHYLVVDLSRVSSVDSAGVALLVELRRVLAEKKGNLQLVGLNEQAAKMIRLSRLDALFDIDEQATNGN